MDFSGKVRMNPCYIEGPQAIISERYCCCLSLNIDFVLANSVDPHARTQIILLEGVQHWQRFF